MSSGWILETCDEGLSLSALKPTNQGHFPPIVPMMDEEMSISFGLVEGVFRPSASVILPIDLNNAVDAAMHNKILLRLWHKKP
jgi:hypothetical protein